MKTALIVVDVQKAFRTIEVCEPSFNSSLPVIRDTIDKFRQAASPIVFTRTSEAHKFKAKDGFQIDDGINVCSKDLIIDKDYPNSFWKTTLEEDLNNMGVTNVIVCGCFSMACVFQTHNGALERGFESQVLNGATITSHEETNNWLKQLADSVDLCSINL